MSRQAEGAPLFSTRIAAEESLPLAGGRARAREPHGAHESARRPSSWRRAVCLLAVGYALASATYAASRRFSTVGARSARAASMTARRFLKRPGMMSSCFESCVDVWG